MDQPRPGWELVESFQLTREQRAAVYAAWTAQRRLVEVAASSPEIIAAAQEALVIAEAECRQVGVSTDGKLRQRAQGR